jgi:hypothetical protein
VKRLSAGFIIFFTCVLLAVTNVSANPENFLIRTYRIEVEVESMDEALPRILTLPGIDLHSELNIQTGSGRMERLVGNHELDATLNTLRGMGNVKGTSSGARNEFALLAGLNAEFRIRNIEYTSLDDLLHQAATLSDFRIIESRLVTLIAEIESLRGRINHLNSEMGTTRLHITLTTIPPEPEVEPEPEPESEPEPELEPEPEPEPGTFQIIGAAFTSSAQATLSVAEGILIFLAHISIPLAAIAIVAGCFWKYVLPKIPKPKRERFIYENVEGGGNNEK